ncbi:hypothetical protein [Nonomuraea sp. NPDC049646]|uniref:hypothetical protein n=1 Tax=unclassified Nonomuraea TaxID=2593643 RepID=UPI0037BB2EBA
MTADPFITPAEAEQASRVEQANDLLASAAGVQHVARSTYNRNGGYTHDYEDGVEAIRDALVGQGHALLAVRDELAGLRAELRQAAAAPREDLAKLASVVRDLATVVAQSAANDADTASAVRDLNRTLEQGVGFADTAAAATEAISTSLHDLLDIVDRPRWWQWRRRWQLRNLAKSLPFPQISDVYEFRLELLRPLEVDEISDGEPLACTTFNATYGNAADIARLLLPSLCDEAGVPADPEQVYGRVAGRDRGGDYLFHTVVFLPGTDVIEAPEEGF